MIIKTIILKLLAPVILFGWVNVSGQLYHSGGYQGGNYGSGGDKTLDVIVVNVKVLLQGAYTDGSMRYDLDSLGLLPLAQPFDSVPLYYHYTGTESVDSIPAGNITDWIEIELRATASVASTATSDSVIGKRAAFLLNNGSVTDLDGVSEVRFKYLKNISNLYAVIMHRNHLGIMSASALTPVNEVHSWDFTTSQSQAHQDISITGNEAVASLGGGNFGLWAGNALADDRVKYLGLQNDREAILDAVGNDTPSAILQLYHNSDLNMDAKVKYMGVDNDKVLIYNILDGSVNDSIISHVP